MYSSSYKHMIPSYLLVVELWLVGHEIIAKFRKFPSAAAAPLFLFFSFLFFSFFFFVYILYSEDTQTHCVGIYGYICTMIVIDVVQWGQIHQTSYLPHETLTEGSVGTSATAGTNLVLSVSFMRWREYLGIPNGSASLMLCDTYVIPVCDPI